MQLWCSAKFNNQIANFPLNVSVEESSLFAEDVDKSLEARHIFYGPQ